MNYLVGVGGVTPTEVELSPYPKFDSDIKTDGATHTRACKPRGYEKVYYSPNEPFWGEHGGSQAGLKMA